MMMGTEGLTANFSFYDDLRGSPDTPFVIGPKTTIDGASVDIPQRIIDGVNGKAIRVFFWGWVTYDDIFDHTHVTMFCSEMTDVALRDASDRKGGLFGLSGNRASINTTAPTRNARESHTQMVSFGTPPKR
jgi:hypothetical protein